MYPSLVPLIFFSIAAAFTPGPNNIIGSYSGFNFGIKKSIPLILGVTFGYTTLITLSAGGLNVIFSAYPILKTIIKILGSLFLIYLAYKIATASKPDTNQQNKAKPITFIQAAAFQWVNPKAWTMALTAISVYSPSQQIESIAIVALVFGIVNLPSVSLWAVLGQQLSKILSSHSRLRVFNFTMAGLLLMSLYPVINP